MTTFYPHRLTRKKMIGKKILFKPEYSMQFEEGTIMDKIQDLESEIDKDIISGKRNVLKSTVTYYLVALKSGCVISVYPHEISKILSDDHDLKDDKIYLRKPNA